VVTRYQQGPIHLSRLFFLIHLLLSQLAVFHHHHHHIVSWLADDMPEPFLLHALYFIAHQWWRTMDYFLRL
jgi:hypothetical protein